MCTRAFIGSDRYALIFDGLDEIPVELRAHFSERLDEFVRGLPSEVGVVVTCRTQEYEQLLAAHSTGLGLVQAVEILPLTSEQLDSAFVELTNRDKDWDTFLSQRHLTAHQRVRDLLSSPLVLNLVVAGGLNPDELLDWTTTDQELQDVVIARYLDRTLKDRSQYEPEDARRYLTWIARFLNGDEVSPFGLKTSDYTVFDLADLTPPEPPRRYWLLATLVSGLIFGLVIGLPSWLVAWVYSGQVWVGLLVGLLVGLIFGLVWGPFKRSAVSSRLTFVWPSTRGQLLDLLRRVGRGLGFGLVVGVFALILAVVAALLVLIVPLVGQVQIAGRNPMAIVDRANALVQRAQSLPYVGHYVAELDQEAFVSSLISWLVGGLLLGLVLGLGSGLLRTRSVLITSRTPKEARSRSLMAVLTWLVFGLVGGLVLGLLWGLVFGLGGSLVFGLILELGFMGLGFGLILALRNGGWFVLLQKVAHRRLARAGNFPPSPYDFLE